MAKQKLLAFLLVAVLILSTGCGIDEKIKVPAQSERKTDDQLTGALKKEKEIQDGEIYMEKGEINGVMIVKDDANTEDAKILAEKYADMLKYKYDAKKVTVQAVQNSKNIAYISYAN